MKSVTRKIEQLMLAASLGAGMTGCSQIVTATCNCDVPDTARIESVTGTACGTVSPFLSGPNFADAMAEANSSCTLKGGELDANSCVETRELVEDCPDTRTAGLTPVPDDLFAAK